MFCGRYGEEGDEEVGRRLLDGKRLVLILLLGLGVEIGMGLALEFGI